MDASVRDGRFDNRMQGIGLKPEQYESRMAGASVAAGSTCRAEAGRRWSTWGGMSVQRGDHAYRNVGGQLGMRVRW